MTAAVACCPMGCHIAELEAFVRVLDWAESSRGRSYFKIVVFTKKKKILSKFSSLALWWWGPKSSSQTEEEKSVAPR